MRSAKINTAMCFVTCHSKKFMNIIGSYASKVLLLKFIERLFFLFVQLYCYCLLLTLTKDIENGFFYIVTVQILIEMLTESTCIVLCLTCLYDFLMARLFVIMKAFQ
jgi:hypothetical protein